MSFMARPPRAWEIHTNATLSAILATALASLAFVVANLQLRSWVLAGADGEVSGLAATMLDNLDAFDFLAMVLVVAYIGTYLWWRKKTLEIIRRIGAEAGLLRHWSVNAWGMCLILSIVVSLLSGDALEPGNLDALATTLGRDAAVQAIRVLGLAFLLYGVWQLRLTIRRAVADAGVAFRVGDLGSSVSKPVPAQPLPPAARAEPPTGLPPADDAFWDGVRRLAAEAGADLALLETTEGVARRWSLIPTTGDVAALRAAVPAGAVITVYPQPPTEAETEGFTPPEADEYYGFLEDAASGSLWYQSVRPNRIPAFLARTRSARRWALYPAQSPEALTAVVPAVSPASSSDL
ncbi:hypothetical protein [Paractinoplanes atraurantiacus]|uniref:Uncharacterized protein n=1 Tax=Paractinoplanes atraurantiacus TaxID=1036182 RepID=A0A285FPV6_9ACTN|nr:hypothetical protein [Actinoplanes atraurantiacus]SNY12356.1 hypothetical protein SAMN05421748_1011022 [Actinoplanes atraurantiacus]